MKIMLIDDKTTDVVTKLKDLKRRYRASSEHDRE